MKPLKCFRFFTWSISQMGVRNLGWFCHFDQQSTKVVLDVFSEKNENDQPISRTRAEGDRKVLFQCYTREGRKEQHFASSPIDLYMDY